MVPVTTLFAPITTWRPIVAPGSTTVPWPEPRPVADRHGTLRHHLLGDRQVRVGVAVVLIGDVDVVTGPHVVADHDLQVADDATPLADQASVTDRDHRIAHHLLARHHARRQGDLRSEHRALADVDVLLVEQRVRWEADHTARAETSEAFAAARVGTDRSEFDRRLPRQDHAVAGRALDPGAQPLQRSVGERRSFEHERRRYCHRPITPTTTAHHHPTTASDERRAGIRSVRSSHPRRPLSDERKAAIRSSLRGAVGRRSVQWTDGPNGTATRDRCGPRCRFDHRRRRNPGGTPPADRPRMADRYDRRARATRGDSGSVGARRRPGHPRDRRAPAGEPGADDPRSVLDRRQRVRAGRRRRRGRPGSRSARSDSPSARPTTRTAWFRSFPPPSSSTSVEPDVSTIDRRPTSVDERSPPRGCARCRGDRSAQAPALERAACRVVSALRARPCRSERRTNPCSSRWERWPS